VANPRDDLDALVNFLLPFAQQMLGKSDEFFPFAAEVSAEGELVAVGIDSGEDDQPASQEVIDAHIELLRSHAAAGQIRACGVCSDTRVTTPETGQTDAVRVALEHRDAEPLDVYLPYSKGPDAYSFGDLIAVAGESRVFA
jgi:hypothetical protein